ncbi:cytochrome c oxidase subunit II [Corynebacterium kroppenstedtii]
MRTWSRKLGLAGVLTAGSYLLSGCSVAPPDNGFFKFLRFGVPDGITPEAKEIGNFWVWTWVAAWIVGIIMWILMFYSSFAFSAKRKEKKGEGEFPRQTQYNVPLELVLTTVPIIIVMVLFFFTVETEDKVTAMDKDPKVKVDVTAFQWNWKFGYDEVDGSLMGGKAYHGRDNSAQAAANGTRKIESNTRGEDGAANPIHGRSKSDLSYLRFDKIETVGTTDEVPVLVLPSQTAIQFDLASADVIHSFWVPEFLFKRDAFPHPEANKSNRTFQIEKIDKEGAFVGRCAEMCGTYHAMMNFEVRVVSPDKFRDYMKFRSEHPGASNADALKKIGEKPYATSTHPFLPGREDTRSANDNYVDQNQAEQS